MFVFESFRGALCKCVGETEEFKALFEINTSTYTFPTYLKYTSSTLGKPALSVASPFNVPYLDSKKKDSTINHFVVRLAVYLSRPFFSGTALIIFIEIYTKH